MPQLRQVPSGLNPSLDGFLRDLRQAVIAGIPQNKVNEIVSLAQTAAVASVSDTLNQTTISNFSDWLHTTVQTVVDSVLNDPNFVALGEQIDVINGPESLPASVRGQLASVNATLQTQLDLQGSSINTLQTTTATQASQITTIQTNVAGNSSAIVILNNTTASQATSISALGTRMGNAESSITTLNATTATQASQLTTLNTTVGNNSASIQTLSQTVSGTGGLTSQYSVMLDVNGYVTGFAQYNSGTSSAFYVRADKFAIGSPGYSSVVPFTVLTSTQGSSTPGVYISGNAFIDGTLYAQKIVTGSLNSLQMANNATGKTYFGSGSTGSAFYSNSSTSNWQYFAATGATIAAPSGGRNAGGTAQAILTVTGTIWGGSSMTTYPQFQLRVVRSTDGGSTWSPVTADPNFNSFYASGGSTTGTSGISFSTTAEDSLGDTETVTYGISVNVNNTTYSGKFWLVSFAITARDQYK